MDPEKVSELSINDYEAELFLNTLIERELINFKKSEVLLADINPKPP